MKFREGDTVLLFCSLPEQISNLRRFYKYLYAMKFCLRMKLKHNEYCGIHEESMVIAYYTDVQVPDIWALNLSHLLLYLLLLIPEVSKYQTLGRKMNVSPDSRKEDGRLPPPSIDPLYYEIGIYF